MKSVAKYKKLIEAIKDTEESSTTDKADDETMKIALRIFNSMDASDQFQILQQITAQPASNRRATDVSGYQGMPESVEDFNKKELIKIKMFFIRMLMTIVLIIIGLMILSALILGSGVIHSSNAVVDEIIAIYGYLFNK